MFASPEVSIADLALWLQEQRRRKAEQAAHLPELLELPLPVAQPLPPAEPDDRGVTTIEVF